MDCIGNCCIEDCSGAAGKENEYEEKKKDHSDCVLCRYVGNAVRLRTGRPGS